jgi:hypothetical protein
MSLDYLNQSFSLVRIRWHCLSVSLSAPDAHKQQAGPNGPENNRDLKYAFSDDQRQTWKSSDGLVLAKIEGKGAGQVECTIKPGAESAKVFETPTGSGILNQEAQSADWEARFWALNRENRSGEEKWMVYHHDVNSRSLFSIENRCADV